MKRLTAALFRHELLAWYLLAFALVAVVETAVPRLRFRFGFDEIFQAGHPVRVGWEEFQEEFGLGPRLLVYLEGPDAFRPAGLAAVEELSATLERIEGIRRVFSVVDLREPARATRHLRLLRVLREEVREDPARLARALGREPLREAWRGLLHDAEHAVLVMIVEPDLETTDPRVSAAFQDRIEAEVAAGVAGLDVAVHMNGLFFVTQEVIRGTARTQERLTAGSFAVIFVALVLFFASPGVAVVVFLLLGVAVVLAVGAMGWCGIPLNFMSGNFPLMIMVIGCADLLHILGFYTDARRRHGPLHAALRAVRATAVPNALTTLSTAGCILATSVTDLQVLGDFSRALALGIGIVYVVTIVYAPLLLRRVDPPPGRGGLPRLQARIAAGLGARWVAACRSPAVPALFGLVALLAAGAAARQTIDSNWFRHFEPHMRLSRCLDMLGRHGLPVSGVDVTVKTDARALHARLEDPALTRDLVRVEEALARQPGVLRVLSVRTVHEEVRRAAREVELPPDLAPVWARARREGVERAFLAGGLYDQWSSRHGDRLRLQALTSLESAREFRDLGEAFSRELPGLGLEVVAPADVAVTGQMPYWGAVIEAIVATFLRSLWGSGLVVLACFLLVTRSVRAALLALLPNLLPVLVMVAAAWVAGRHLTENICLLVSLAMGIAVDDTLHLLHHHRAGRVRGLPTEAALARALRLAGAPVVVTSVLLLGGFAVCLLADVTAIKSIGALVMVAIATALLADLVLLPALLLRVDPWGDADPPGGVTMAPDEGSGA